MEFQSRLDFIRAKDDAPSEGLVDRVGDLPGERRARALAYQRGVDDNWTTTKMLFRGV